jgi:hypothetical protein
MSYFDQKKLRAEIVQATAYVRQTLNQHGVDHRFTFKVIVEGSADRADAKLRFNFDISGYYGTSVESPQLSDALNELLRRMGFDTAHKAELLTFDPAEAERLAVLQTPVAAPPQPQE